MDTFFLDSGIGFPRVIQSKSSKFCRLIFFTFNNILQPTLQLAFLTLCDQAFNPPFLSGKLIIELAKFCFMNKRFETNLSFFSKPVIVSHCVFQFQILNFRQKNTR